MRAENGETTPPEQTEADHRRCAGQESNDQPTNAGARYRVTDL